MFATFRGRRAGNWSSWWIHRLCSRQSIGIESSKNLPFVTACAIISWSKSSKLPPSGLVCAIIGLLSTIYNYSRNVSPIQYSLQISNGCISLALLVQSQYPKYGYIIRMMRSSTARAVFIKYRQLSTKDTSNRQRDLLFRHDLYGLQSTKHGYNNHLRDASFYDLCSCQSIG